MGRAASTTLQGCVSEGALKKKIHKVESVMARIDDYIAAKKLAVEKLASIPFEEILACSGYSASAESTLLIPFLNRTYTVSYPDFTFTDSADADTQVPIQEEVLILHYLSALTTIQPSGNWVAYREIPGAGFYFSAFEKRAIDPLKTSFGQNTKALESAAAQLEAIPIDTGDAGFELNIMPRVPVQMIMWEGDEEFEPEANILFDQSVGQILSPEDIAWLAGMIVYRLMALSR